MRVRGSAWADGDSCLASSSCRMKKSIFFLAHALAASPAARRFELPDETPTICGPLQGRMFLLLRVVADVGVVRGSGAPILTHCSNLRSAAA